MDNKGFDFVKVKTFADACKRLGIRTETFLFLAYIGDTEAFLRANALYKLFIIQEAINNGVWMIRMAGAITLTGGSTQREKWRS